MPTSYSEADYEILRTVGKIFRQHRRYRSLTQEQLAELTDINVTYLSDVERGKRNLSLLNIARLAHAFGLPLEDIFKSEKVNDNTE